MLNVAFITLLERKILGYRQIRLGPNKPAYLGLAQPFADAIKLFLNKNILLSLRVWLIKFIPGFGLFLVLLIWRSFPILFNRFRFNYRVLMLLILLRLRVYPVMLIGWRSNRKYSKLGSVRNVAQSISYEVRLALILLLVLFLHQVICFVEFFLLNLFTVVFLPRLLVIWLISRLGETNRTPFDFSEGERELVSGFNVEFRRFRFALIFMREYSRIYFFSRLRLIIFFQYFWVNLFGFVIIVFFWVWVRATLPRYRYDFFIELNWKIILPVVLSVLFWVVRLLE